MEKYTYEVTKTPIGETIILRSDGASIPSDPANSDYQAYLAKDEVKADEAKTK